MNSHTMVVEMMDKNIDKQLSLWTRGLLFLWFQNPNKSKVRKHNSNEVLKSIYETTSTVLNSFKHKESMYPETLYFSYDIGSLYWDNKEIEEQKGNKSK